MSEVKLFSHPKYGKIRVVMQGDQAWIVAKDLFNCAGVANPRNVFDSLETWESSVCDVPVPGGSEKLIAISEGGVRTVLEWGERAEEEKQKLLHWIIDEVFPAFYKDDLFSYAERKFDEITAQLSKMQSLSD